MADQRKKILVGRIGAPHGVRGDVRVKSFTGDPLALGDYGPLTDGAGHRYDVLDIRSSKTVVVVRFKQVTSRERAEALNGTELFVDREQLPDAVLEEDEFFVEDLVGLLCFAPDGSELGRVTAVENYGAGDIIDVAMAGGRREMFAFDLATVPEVDIAAGRLTLVVPGEIIVNPDPNAEPDEDA